MGHIVIAPLDEDAEALYIGIKDFPTNHLIVICVPKKFTEVEKLKKDLTRFNIRVSVQEIRGHPWEEIFRIISDLASRYGQEVLVNIGAGDRTTRCAATSAAFVNGLRAFDVVGKTTMVLPVLKFSYYKMLTDKKLLLLKILFKEKDGALDFEALSEKAKIGPSLLSYHLNGTLKSTGLRQLGLVDIINARRPTRIKLTMMGRLLTKGYIH